MKTAQTVIGIAGIIAATCGCALLAVGLLANSLAGSGVGLAVTIAGMWAANRSI